MNDFLHNLLFLPEQASTFAEKVDSLPPTAMPTRKSQAACQSMPSAPPAPRTVWPWLPGSV